MHRTKNDMNDKIDNDQTSLLPMNPVIPKSRASRLEATLDKPATENMRILSMKLSKIQTKSKEGSVRSKVPP